MDVRRFLGVLRRRWRFLVAALGVGTALTVYLTLSAASVYSSTATLFVSTPPSTSGVTDALVATAVLQDQTRSYVQLVSNDDVLQRAAERLDISAAKLDQDVSAEYVEATLLLRIDSEAGSARTAQKITSVMAEEVMKKISELDAPDKEGRRGTKALPFIVEVGSRASLPSSPVEPRLPLSLGIGLLLTLVGGLAGTLVREALDTTVESGEEVEALTGSMPLAVLPIDENSSEGLSSTSAQFSLSSEAVRGLVTNLSFCVDTPAYVALVTSVRPGDGTTYVATNLAKALGRSTGSVLLVDADLRRRGRDTEAPSSVGLVSVLLGDAGFDEVVRSRTPGVDFLGTGPLPPNPAEVLQTKAMHDVIARARQRYSVVIIDVPSVLTVADAATLVPEADGVVLVARHGVTHREHLRQAVARIGAVGGRLFGTVLNIAPPGSTGYAAYGYHPDGVQEGRKRARPVRTQGRRVKR